MRAIDPASVSLAVYGATQLFQLASNQRAEVYALTADKEFAEQLATLLAGTSAKVIEELQTQLKGADEAVKKHMPSAQGPLSARIDALVDECHASAAMVLGIVTEQRDALVAAARSALESSDMESGAAQGLIDALANAGAPFKVSR